MNKIDRISHNVFLKDGKLHFDEPIHNYKLVREHDNNTHFSEDIKWIEYDETRRFKKEHTAPEINRSLLMSPFNEFFTWNTTLITKLISTEYPIKFETENSNYILYKL